MRALMIAVLMLSGVAEAKPLPKVILTLDLGNREPSTETQSLVKNLIGDHFETKREGGKLTYTTKGWPRGSTPENRDKLITSLEKACSCTAQALEVNDAAENKTLSKASSLRDSTLHPGAYDGNLKSNTAVGGEVVAGHSGVPVPKASPAKPKKNFSDPPPSPGMDVYQVSQEVAKEPDIAQAGITPQMLYALARAESGLKLDYELGDVHGLMAISEPTAALLGYSKEDLLKPRLNMEIGATILASLLREFDGNLPRALAAYQLGASAVWGVDGIPNDPKVAQLLAAFNRDYAEIVKLHPAAAVKKHLKRAAPSAADAKYPEDSLPLKQRQLIYERLAYNVAQSAGVDPNLMVAMAHKENDTGDRKRKSKKGAQGLAQFTKSTAKLMGVEDRTDPDQSYHGMAKYLKKLLDKFDGDPVLAVAAYNCGDGCIQKRDNHLPKIEETQDYVRKIFADYNSRTGKNIDVESYIADARDVIKKK